MTPRSPGLHVAVLAVLLAGAAASAGPVPPGVWPSRGAVEVLTECALPPVHPGEKPIDLQSPALRTPLPMAYAADVPLDAIRSPENREKYPVRVAVLDAFDAIREAWRPVGKRPTFRAEFRGTATDAVKKELEKEQVFPARAITKLELALVRLELVEPLRAAEPKRWQAHHAYAIAQVKARLAFLDEYNARLGNIRTDSLPDLDRSKGQDGYRLEPTEKVRSKQGQRLADESKEQFATIAADHPNTPWAVLADRAAGTPLGLRWEVIEK